MHRYRVMALFMLVSCNSIDEAQDGDRDGWSDALGDCNDEDAGVFPGARERPNSTDDDCDDVIDEGTSLQDLDLDGHVSDAYGGTDCDDEDDQINPDVEERCSDTIDNNCDQNPDPCVFSGDVPVTLADTRWTGTDDEALGSALVGVGDVTGDGVADLAIGAPGGGRVAVVSVLDGAPDSGWTWSEFSIQTEVAGLGGAVTGLGDVDGDGYVDLASSSSGPGSAASAVVIWSGPITAEGPASTLWLTEEGDDQLGYALAGGADLDGDGWTDLAVGQPGFTGDSVEAGGVVYLWPGGDASTSTELASSLTPIYQGSMQDGAGSALATGDWNADGLPDLAIGLPSSRVVPEDPSAPRAGAVVILDGRSDLGAEILEEDAWISGVDEGDSAGRAVALVGDRDGDGYPDLAVGAPGAGPYGGDATGIVYELMGPLHGAVPLASATTRWQGARAGDEAGASLGGGGDVNADGSPELIVGAPFATSYGTLTGAGRVYLAAGPVEEGTFRLSEDTTATWGGPGHGSQAGRAVSTPADLNGDGYDELAIGVPTWGESSESQAGAAFVFLGLGI